MNIIFNYLRLSIYCFIISISLCSAQTANLPLDQIKLPEGFALSIYANNVEDARQMALGSKGTVFVGSRKGHVYALVDKNNDYRVDKKILIAQGLELPSGIAIYQNDLYVAAVHQILRYNNIEEFLINPPNPEVLINSLPKEKHHGWKYIAFGPDGKLYVPVGAPCNICLKTDKRYASILTLNIETKAVQIFAHGVRNSVGFAWHPMTQELWFTDNGRDWLGDDTPPDELNRATKSGLHFGYPYQHGNSVKDPKFGQFKHGYLLTPPEQELGAHIAPLGVLFYTGDMFPEKYQGSLFVAEHGSWNRSKKVGYQISLATLKNNQVVTYEPFVTGWLQSENYWGRPVALLQLPDGSILISDDYANAIYRLVYNKKANSNE